jgi:hypothetical protein
MKTRFLIALALLAAACSSSGSETGQVTRTNPPTTAVTTTAPTPPTTSAESVATSIADTTSLPPTTVGIPSTPVPCEAPPESAVYCEPFVLDQGATQVIWDRWFWGQGVFSKGTVEVVTDGEVVASGPFFGSESIMVQGPDRDFLFYNTAGAVVATVTQQELSDAIAQAIEDAGLSG